MKKFYLLLSLVVFSLGLKAQLTCPSIAFSYIFSAPQHCVINVGHAAWIGQTDIKISLKTIGGTFIPEYGTDGSPSDELEVAVNPATGSASFFYDCTGPAPAVVLVKRVVANTPVEFCEITNITAPAPMPMKVTSFNGRLETDVNVDLKWTSMVEFDSYQYQVERSSDGKNFVKVGALNAAGASNTAINYNFKDQLPAAGDYFYRLKQVDLDGTAEYSKIVYVNSRKGAGIVTKLFPNPFQSEVQLIGATSADLNTPGNVRVFTMSGQLVNFRVVGANSIAIDPNAAKGVYFLKFRNSTNTSEQTFKLIKQ